MSETTAPTPASNDTVLGRLCNYLVLPSEVTDFERRYVQRMNRIALTFFYWHLPVFCLVAFLNDTGPLFAAVLTLITLAGPTLAYRTFRSQRAISMTFGFTAMCMGGLLVHFGQGPVQIEMHFYFFALLAMLALFGNPAVVLVAAVTVAVHHCLLWAVLPASVFNYDAPFWVVGVHALFVVLESVASCFIARSFFDNVIGLEKIVEKRTAELDARNRDMRLVLDNVGQGFLTISPEGVMSAERSAILTEWFGEPEEDSKFWDYLSAKDSSFGSWFQLAWEAVLEGFLPLELTLDQLPKKMRIGEQHLRLAYTPILDGDEIVKMLVVITDVTSLVKRQEAEVEQREILDLFGRILNDKTGFLEFVQETEQIMEALASDGPTLAQVKRLLHTVKGNAALYGLGSIAGLCSDIEEGMRESEGPPAAEALEHLVERWTSLREKLGRLLGDRRDAGLEIDDQDYEAVLAAVLNDTPKEELARMITNWKLEPTMRRLERIAEQARAMAARLDRGEIDVHTVDNDLRLDADRWAPFWSSFVHVLRNAIDHGLELPDERESNGKPAAGCLSLSTYLEGSHFVVEVSDDGRGVDWEAVEQRASEKGLPHSSRDDLLRALFTDGLTTRDEVTEISGRGVGMGAVRDACEALGGEMHIESDAGRGTKILFRFPERAMADFPSLAA